MKWRSLIILALGALILFLFVKRKTVLSMEHLRQIFIKFEGFRAKPYWDVRQWSWGYGTRVPGSIDDKTKMPVGEITKIQAMIDAVKHATNDWAVLKPLLKVELSDKQQAALLSFSYNLGQANAKKIITKINANDLEGLGYSWRSYVKAKNPAGILEPLEGLVSRRNYEWDLYNS